MKLRNPCTTESHFKTFYLKPSNDRSIVDIIGILDEFKSIVRIQGSISNRMDQSYRVSSGSSHIFSSRRRCTTPFHRIGCGFCQKIIPEIICYLETVVDWLNHPLLPPAATNLHFAPIAFFFEGTARMRWEWMQSASISIVQLLQSITICFCVFAPMSSELMQLRLRHRRLFLVSDLWRERPARS